MGTKALLPVGYVLFFTLLGTYLRGPEMASFFVLNNAVFAMTVNSLCAVTSKILLERGHGTLVYLFASPVGRLRLFLGPFLFHLLDGILGAIFALLFGILVFQLPAAEANWMLIGFTLLIVTLSTGGLGLAVGSFGLVYNGVSAVTNLLWSTLLLLAGVIVPIADLPPLLVKIGQLFPLTRGLVAIQMAFQGASWPQVRSLLVGELLVGACSGLIGYGLFLLVERLARRRGTIDWT